MINTKTKGQFSWLPFMNTSIFFYFLLSREFLLVDPTDKEETIMDGRMTMAMNIHREICGAVMGGGVSLESDQVFFIYFILYQIEIL